MTTPRKLETVRSKVDAEERMIARLMALHRFSRFEAEYFMAMLGDES